METKNKEFRLPRKFAEKWIEALESGNYTQTPDVLYNSDNDGYCCIGVACILEYNKKALLKEDGYYAETLKSNTEVRYDMTKTNLRKIPNELKGSANKNKLVKKLTAMNDVECRSFKEIAFWIRENVELYD